MKKVGIVMGSDSDLPIIRKATDTLRALGVPFEAHVYSGHSTPAHLAGAVAANTTLPVIGIPCKSNTLDGIDALLSTVQMPSGIPVATVAINGGANAALLSAQILALGEPELAKKLEVKRAADAKAVLEKNAAVSAELNSEV